MSELNVYHHELRHNEYEEFYLKYEADKVIAEKDKELRHQKYKRCLAMARWCGAEVYHLRRTPLGDKSEHEYWQYENDFWKRWQNRWLVIADKFKEAK